MNKREEEKESDLGWTQRNRGSERKEYNEMNRERCPKVDLLVSSGGERERERKRNRKRERGPQLYRGLSVLRRHL